MASIAEQIVQQLEDDCGKHEHRHRHNLYWVEQMVRKAAEAGARRMENKKADAVKIRSVTGKHRHHLCPRPLCLKCYPDEEDLIAAAKWPVPAEIAEEVVSGQKSG